MKKVIYIIGIILVIIVGLIFYMNTGKKENKDVTINIADLASKMKEQDLFEDTLEEIDKDTIKKNYGFDGNKIKNIVSYVGTGATAEEILVVELNNKSDLNEINNQITQRISERKEAFANYLPQEVYKLENPTLKVTNNYIILSVCKDSEKMNSFIEDYLKNL